MTTENIIIQPIETYINKYVDYLKKLPSINNTKMLERANEIPIVLIHINNKYYMFYNEHFGTNANDLLIQFPYDGICKHDNIICYYIAFNDYNHVYFEKLSDYTVIILDNMFNVLTSSNDSNYNEILLQNSILESPIVKKTPSDELLDEYIIIS
jgi:hypothetical protein